MVIPSRHEAMSIVVLEAGICGAPVLITDQCGFDDVALQEGGVVVAATVEGLQKGLLAMTSNPERLRTMGKNLKKYTQDLFLWAHIVKRHLELFAEKGGQLPVNSFPPHPPLSDRRSEQD